MSISSQPIKTFTIGFEDSKFDESPYAESVARHLSADHNTIIVTESDALQVVENLGCFMTSHLQTRLRFLPWYVKCTSIDTVALSGDGGDELFGGYNRYLWGSKIWRKLDKFPFPLRFILGS